MIVLQENYVHGRIKGGQAGENVHCLGKDFLEMQAQTAQTGLQTENRRQQRIWMAL